jgi:dipeptidyl aminopeptidase/acylaminoacyl peptidase
VGTSLIEQLAAVAAVCQDYRPYAVSPDGRTLAFQWYHDGDWQIFTLDLEGGEPCRVGDIADPCWSPTFSPDGRYLYFSRDDRGSERFDFYRCELATGKLEDLLPDTPDFSPLQDFDLSPDGARIAMTASHGAGYSIAVMPAAVTPRGDGIAHHHGCPYTETSPRWSPDGTRLAAACGTRGQDTAVYVVDAATGDTAVLGGDDSFFAGHPAWSPDGRTLAFNGGPGDHPAIGLYDVESGAVSWVWDGPLDAHHPAWAPDGTGLAFLIDCEAETGLCHIDLRTGAVRELSVGAGNHYAPSFAPDGSALLCVFSGPGAPGDIYRVDLAGGVATPLTRSLPAGLAAHDFRSGAPVHFRSLDHLAEVPGLLVEPDEPNGAAVVMIHGGPTWHHSNEWDALRQAFVAAGVTVLHPNYRGSDGYGRNWQLANRFLMGQGEALDCAAAHAYLVALGCDPARIAVTGRSWGGFLTMAMVTQFPELWAAGVAGVPFFDFIDSATDPTIREDLRWWDRQNTGDPIKDRDKLEYYSPIKHLDRIQAPLLLLAGELDPRCPPRQSREVAQMLAERGKRCEVVVYPDEGHEISGLEHRIDYDVRTVEFMLEHVGVATD